LPSTSDERHVRKEGSFAQAPRSCDEHHRFHIAPASDIGDMLRCALAVSTLTLDLQTANPSKGGDAKPPV
jgi:hypothetical protein